jgi:hypothetical protein
MESGHDRLHWFAVFKLVFAPPCGRFKSRRRLESEVLVLRHQLNILRRRNAVEIPEIDVRASVGT